MENPVYTLLSVLLGGFLTIAGGFMQQSLMSRSERRAVAAAIRAEIMGILEITEARQHERAYKGYLGAWKNGHELQDRPVVYGLTSYEKAETDPIFNSHVDRLGTLPHEIVTQIIRFYALVRGIRIDLVAIHNGDVKDNSLIACVEEDIILWNRAKELGASLEQKLSKLC